MWILGINLKCCCCLHKGNHVCSWTSSFVKHTISQHLNPKGDDMCSSTCCNFGWSSSKGRLTIMRIPMTGALGWGLTHTSHPKPCFLFSSIQFIFKNLLDFSSIFLISGSFWIQFFCLYFSFLLFLYLSLMKFHCSIWEVILTKIWMPTKCSANFLCF